MRKKRAIHDKLYDIEAWIRKGSMEKASSVLARMTIEKVPEAYLPKFAGLCRRAGLYHKSFLALEPLVRDQPVATLPPVIRSEYAIVLQRRGAVRLALEYLKEIDATHHPEALLYRGHCHLSAWNLAEAMSDYAAYVPKASNDYLRGIGNINLAAVMVTLGKLAEAAPLLRESIATAREAGNTRALAYCLDIQTQIYLQEKNFTAAEASLREASSLVGDSQTQEALFLRKWKAVLEGLQSSSWEPLDRFRAEKSSAVEYETLRIVDLFKLRARFDQSLFSRLYVGSPFPGLREILRTEFPEAVPPEEGFYFEGSTDGRLILFDWTSLRDLTFDVSSESFRLLRVLASDFYQPFRSIRIAEDMVPIKEIQVTKVGDLVRLWVTRLNTQLKKSGLDFTVMQEGGKYRLFTEKPFSLVVPTDQNRTNPEKIFLAFLESNLSPGEKMTLSQLAELLKLTENESRRVLESLIDSGHLLRTGHARATRYSLKKVVSE